MALAVVQTAFKNNSFVNPNVVLGGAPTAGNLIIAFFRQTLTTGKAINTTDWTQFSINGLGGVGNDTMYGMYRYAQGGDSATLPNLSNDATAANIPAVAAEISGVSGTFANDFQAYTTDSTTPTTGPTTAYNNELAFACSTGNGGFGSYTPGTGWTNAQYNTTSSTILDYKAYPTAGTLVSDNPSNTVGGTSGKWITCAFQIPPINIPLGAVSASGAAAAVIAGSDASVTLGAVSGAGAAAAVAIASDGNVTLTAVSGAGAAASLPTLDSAALVAVSAAGVAAQVGTNNHVSITLGTVSAGGSASALLAPPGALLASVAAQSRFGDFGIYSTPVPILPAFSIMRDVPVASSGAMSDDPVLGVGSLYPSGPDMPLSTAVHLEAVTVQSHFSSMTPFFNVNVPLIGVEIAASAQPVIGIGNVI